MKMFFILATFLLLSNCAFSASTGTSIDCTNSAQRPTCVTLFGRADVAWWGAVGDNSTDSTTAIQAAINYMNSTYSSGIVSVYVCGNYLVSSTITIPRGIWLEGGGSSCSIIRSGNGLALSPMVHFTGNYNGMEKIGLVNDNGNGSRASNTVMIDAGTITTTLRDNRIVGGRVALLISGTDDHILFNFISAGTNGTASIYSHSTSAGGGSNWYVRNKVDGDGTQARAVVIDSTVGSGTTVMENHFTDNNFSGYATAALRIDDHLSPGRIAMTTLQGNVLGGRVEIVSHKLTSLMANELSGNIAISAGASNVALSGNIAQSAVTAIGAVCAANIAVTC